MGVGGDKGRGKGGRMAGRWWMDDKEMISGWLAMDGWRIGGG